MTITREEVRKTLQATIGSPNLHTLGQIMATIETHGGAIVEHTGYRGTITTIHLGELVVRGADTTILLTPRTL